MTAWSDTEASRRRRQPRAAVRLDCVLTRRKGAPVNGHTIDVGPGGMRVETERPLGVDEVLHFDFPIQGNVDGDARVLREHGPNVYALRFEAMHEEAATRLAVLAATG